MLKDKIIYKKKISQVKRISHNSPASLGLEKSLTVWV